MNDDNQGRSKKQLEGSAFFVGLSFAGIIALIMWIIILRWMNL